MKTNHVVVWLDHKEAHILFFDADKNDLERALVLLAQSGVTSCTPSMISAPIGELVAAIDEATKNEKTMWTLGLIFMWGITAIIYFQPEKELFK